VTQEQYGTAGIEASLSEEERQQWAQLLETSLAPSLDRRVVGNLAAAVASSVQTERARTWTEVGVGRGGPAHAQAGMQRRDHALHHGGWQARLIGEVRGEHAEQRLALMQARHERGLEQAEHKSIVGQSCVRRRRTRRPHHINQVPASLRVPGLEWEYTLLVGTSGIPVLMDMCWWQRHMGEAGQPCRLQQAMVIRASTRWGTQVLHVVDRGEGSGKGLWRWGRSPTRVVVRWNKGQKLRDAAGQERKAWEIARGTRGWGERKAWWDIPARTYRQTGVVALPVRHAEYPGDLFLVVVRQGKGREPWELVFACATRWNREEHFRFEKSAQPIDPFRVQEEAQRPRLRLVTLAASFLLASLAPTHEPACCIAGVNAWIGAWSKGGCRWALSRLWLASPPRLTCCRPSRAPTHSTWPSGSLRWWMTLWNGVAWVPEHLI
jgi:hypothetical protein